MVLLFVFNAYLFKVPQFGLCPIRRGGVGGSYEFSRQTNDSLGEGRGGVLQEGAVHHTTGVPLVEGGCVRVTTPTLRDHNRLQNHLQKGGMERG